MRWSILFKEDNNSLQNIMEDIHHVTQVFSGENSSFIDPLVVL